MKDFNKTGKCQICEKEGNLYLSNDFRRTYYICAECKGKLYDWTDWKVMAYYRPFLGKNGKRRGTIKSG